MSKTRLLISGAILPLVLIMGACNKKDKGDAVEFPSPEVAQLSVSSVDSRAIEKLLKVDDRKVSNAEADKALAQMGLDSSGDGALSWDKKSGKAGNYTYNNLSGTGKNGKAFQVKKLELTGVHMVGDEPNFDRIDFQGLDVTDDDGTVIIDRLSLSRPSPKLGASILGALETLENIKDLRDLDVDVELDDDDMAFGALLMGNVSVKSDDGDVKLGTLGWGENEGTEKAVFLLENLDVTSRNKPGKPAVTLSLKSVSATGVDMDHIRKVKENDRSNPVFEPYKKSFDGFRLKDFSMAVDTMSLKAPLITSQAKTRGDTLVVEQSLEPMTLSFSGTPEDAGLRQAWTFLQGAGYETLELSGGSTTLTNESADTIEIKDSFLSLKDGFDLRFGFSGEGLKGMSEKLDASSNGANPDDFLNSLSLSSLNLNLTDRSIVDRVFQVIAEQQGQKPGDLKKLAKGSLMLAGFSVSMQAKSDEEGEILTEAITSLSDFLSDGGALDISLSPPEPLPGGYLSNIDPQKMDVTKLGLRIQHSKSN